MKAKYTLKKEMQKNKFKRTLNLGNRLKSQTTTNSKKNLTIATNENNNNTMMNKSKNKNKYNTIVLPRSQTNKKLIITNHIILKSKDKNIKKPGIKRCTTEQNQRTINKNQKNQKSPYFRHFFDLHDGTDWTNRTVKNTQKYPKYSKEYSKFSNRKRPPYLVFRIMKSEKKMMLFAISVSGISSQRNQ